MRIGVDGACFANGRGYGRFAREVLRAMLALGAEHEFVCFVDALAAERFDLAAPNLRLVPVEQRESPAVAAAADGARSPGDMLRLTRAVWRERLDVFFSPSVYTYFPLPPGLAAVVTVHDAIADRFPSLTLPSARARLFWRMKVKLALAQARIVLTVSDYAAKEVSSVLRVPNARIRVAVEAPAEIYRPSSPEEIAAARERAGLAADARWFTYVGGFNPHKRVEDIVHAHAAIAREQGPSAPHLLLVGATSGDVFHGSIDAIRAAIAAEGTGSLVKWLGFVPDEELRHLLTGSVASLLPSECEGFGLPAVEAAACGTPVIATTASPLPALLAGGGFFVEPRDVPALTRAMRTLLEDHATRDAMAATALERARALTWAASGRAALDAVEAAVQEAA
jgi:alpha-1,3-rhamnosyl/mannosyltransferase